ncbi:MAG: tRNA epoxyqueuosine(34) reductase QueG [Gammaproteobacteria bacterium]|nr:tRNA epoxyqueuosine(34) reductase QueG [Gammaproteobacteria bacterium]
MNTGAGPATPGCSGLAEQLREWARALGFQRLGITGVDLGRDEQHLLRWLERGFHGDMGYMARHGTRRTRPAELRAGTVRVVSVRMDYYPAAARPAEAVLADPGTGYVSRYALGRDYHKVVRGRLERLARRLGERIGPFGYRVFCDSAPVLEKALARNAGLGWIGKHSNLIARDAGSWFFLGEIYTDLPLPLDAPETQGYCGRCTACLDVCPTRAIVGPYQVDARRCISYHTIELHGPIPEEFRVAMGNRIYGCDDCQLVCPWNRFARPTPLADFAPREGLDAPRLADLFGWSEAQFRARTEGSPIRRIGHERWLRNVAVALGNAPATAEVLTALRARAAHPSALVREHVAWALGRHGTGRRSDPG